MCRIIKAVFQKSAKHFCHLSFVFSSHFAQASSLCKSFFLVSSEYLINLQLLGHLSNSMGSSVIYL